jgi:ATP-dependent RNA circularization protein (DNA/RNA ligase family)
VLSPEDVRSLLGNEVAVEEKLDGANVGLSAPEGGKLRVQNRGHYLEAPYTGQFARLGSWIAAHEARNMINMELSHEASQDTGPGAPGS